MTETLRSFVWEFILFAKRKRMTAQTDSWEKAKIFHFEKQNAKRDRP